MMLFQLIVGVGWLLIHVDRGPIHPVTINDPMFTTEVWEDTELASCTVCFVEAS